MSWMKELYETYEAAHGDEKLKDAEPRLSPICHSSQNAHVEITIDGDGNFKSAKVIDKKDAPTLIPTTEDSSTRVGQCAPHPLCDSIQHIAGDFAKYSAGKRKSYFDDTDKKEQGYKSLISDWVKNFPTQKNEAVLKYILKGSVVADLIKDGVLFTDEDGKLLDVWTGEQKEKPKIFEVCQNPENPFVRWKVYIDGVPGGEVWDDEELFESWIKYDSSFGEKKDICFVVGEKKRITEKHPSKIRTSGDMTKIISSNDKTNFTFKGRFKEAEQAAGVSYEVSQKAHAALRWLIARGQAFWSDSLHIVSWEVTGKDIPKSFESDDFEFEDSKVSIGDMGQAYAKNLNSKIAGFKQDLETAKKIVVLGLDSTGGSTGRLAVVYYRELTGSEFLARLEKWHLDFAWFQKTFRKEDANNPKSKNFLFEFQGAPSLKSIVFTAYSSKVDDNLRKATIKRLLPCVIDGQRMPFDLVNSACRRVANRVSMDNSEWEKTLGIACSLFKGYKAHEGEVYRMGLETERKTRDYLFGRLLAVAEAIENKALWIAGEEKGRVTNAERYMQRFSTHPCSTWVIIEKSLAPSEQRLKVNRPKFLFDMKNLMDEICSFFDADEFSDDKPLTGEFLLGYHCQRHELNKNNKKTNPTEGENNDELE